MRDPFRITEPTCIMFSGGRTSAYMLWRVLQSNDGLPSDCVVCFANTGKEEEATLRFVQRCSDEWGVPIKWLEYTPHKETRWRFRVVNFETASRNGEPFEAMILNKKYMPNPVTRICTGELKIKTMANYLLSIGMAETQEEGTRMSFIGIRADEPRRAAKQSDKSRIPLYLAGVDVREVGQFWSSQPFNLELPTYNGRTLAGNCDLCFLKPANQVFTLIQERPERAIWWAKMEAMALPNQPSGVRFRSDRPSYQQMLDYSYQQANLFDADEEGIGCFCGD
ncbi:MAG: Nin-like protein [Proteobacteria bacterium]|nr:Nin-like protein [Pseudomonadota bacterium]